MIKAKLKIPQGEILLDENGRWTSEVAGAARILNVVAGPKLYEVSMGDPFAVMVTRAVTWFRRAGVKAKVVTLVKAPPLPQGAVE